jgi:hypothetical protein
MAYRKLGEIFFEQSGRKPWLFFKLMEAIQASGPFEGNLSDPAQIYCRH